MRRCIFCFFVLFVFAQSLAAGEYVYKKKDLYQMGKVIEYTGESLRTIAFPIGGLGTGNITLGGRGEIREVEVFNRPNKGKSPELTFFSLCAVEEGKEPVARILERKLIPPYEAWMGIPRHTLPGVARFDEVVFRGEYPFAYLEFRDDEVPVEVSLEAYNPYIPLNPEESGIPAAIFNWKVKNRKNVPLRVSIVFSMMNPIKTSDEKGVQGLGRNLNKFIDESGFRGIMMTASRGKENDPGKGSMAFVTREKNVDFQTRWYRGGWWDNAHVFWDDFADDGRIANLRDAEESAEGCSDVASLLVSIELKPGEEKTLPFYLTWYFPLRENYWNREEDVKGKLFQNYYAKQFRDAWDVAHSLVEKSEQLYQDTKTFHDVLFRSSYPLYVIDAVSSQASSLKTNLVMRTEDGKFYGFEGLSDDRGCCPMNCTHVWNYEQTLAYLFPCLERTVRETDFLQNTFDNGYQVFRTLMPLGNYWWTFKPCADGQMGNIVRVYREWKMSGDTDWLRKLWPRVKAALEFAWKGVGDVGKNLEWQKQRLVLPWDPDKDGCMEGEQHNTYDIEFYGPNTMAGSLYLAALKACSEMAEALGEKAASEEYLEIFRKGQKEYETILWNGEYYIQYINVMEGLVVPEHLKSPVKECENPECRSKQSPGGKKNALEGGEDIPKYQHGEGCLSDQLLGQYLAFVTGLGYVLDSGHVDKAMKSIFDYNFRRDLSSFSNVQRVYALNNEPGLLLCSWPKGKRPALPFVYSDEVWTGIEYQVAASLIYSGHVEQGLTVVKAVRERHRGFNRNPWNEFECGHHYARAMASWAVLLALSGYQYDGVKHWMSFSPRINQDDFSTFWSTGNGWGSFELKKKGCTLKVEYGKLELGMLSLPKEYGFRGIRSIRVNSQAIEAKFEEGGKLFHVTLREIAKLQKGDGIEIIFQ